MTTFLDKILASRRDAIQRLRSEARSTDGPEPRDFRAALVTDGMSVIAEIKRASPSKGDLNTSLDAATLAKTYERGGARALSVLTEPEFFLGSPEDFVAAREATMLPALWKDFVLDPLQADFARSCGADAVLVIVRIVSDSVLNELIEKIRELGMTPMVEVFNEHDLERALTAQADVIGINHRDLETFAEDPTGTSRLRPLIPDDVAVVGASAITSRADVEALEDVGVDAILVAEALVTANDPEAKLHELLGR